jgi:hypothetical protein
MPAPTAINTERGSKRNAVASVDVCSRNLTREKIEVRQQGIKVDDDSDPAPENVPRSKDPPPPVNGTWEEPTHCPRRANNIQDRSGTFVNHRWDEIADYNGGKPLGFSKTFVQVIEGTRFLIHCTKDHDYVRKIMLTHGLLDEIQDHSTWWLMEDTWKTFKYFEPFSCHNRGKHWVDDVNNRQHDPIGLESA